MTDNYEIIGYFDEQDPIWQIEEALHKAHLEALTKLIEQGADPNNIFYPFPACPQTQLLRQIDDCDITFEFEDSALSFKRIGSLLKVYLYNRDDWKTKTIAATYKHYIGYDCEFWQLVTVSKSNEPWIIDPTKTDPGMLTGTLVELWYGRLYDHALQKHLDEISQWHRALQKLKNHRRHIELNMRNRPEL